MKGVALSLAQVGLSRVKGVKCMARKAWRKFLQRTALATAVAFFVAVVPLPVWTPDWFLYWQVPATVFVMIVYVGKLLIDTILFPPKP